jgi:sec-independent protein translocase protein TatA
MGNFILLGIFGGQEMLFVLLIVILLFGARKIPDLMRGLGKGVAEYKRAKDEMMTEVDKAKSDVTEEKKN